MARTKEEFDQASDSTRLFLSIQLVPVERPEEEPALNAVEAGAQGAQRGQE